ncbi:MAG: four helix bundle protein [Bacteroidia bacterium]|nr:four helix bundle protein [Bacteroidia bacterium]
MALYYDLPVFKDVYKLVQKIFEYTKDFPREYKYTLGQDMKRDAIQLIRSIYRANKAIEKKTYLEAFLDDFELLKFEIRLCVDMKILAIKKQVELTQLMDVIGKQIVGWRNASLT